MSSPEGTEDPTGSQGPRRLSDSGLPSLNPYQPAESGRAKRWASQPMDAGEVSTEPNDGTVRIHRIIKKPSPIKPGSGNLDLPSATYLPDPWTKGLNHIHLEHMSSDTSTISLPSEKQKPYTASTVIELRHFVHEASHILHNYSEDLKTWCERRFGRKPLPRTVDIESGRSVKNQGSEKEPRIPGLDGAHSESVAPTPSTPYGTDSSTETDASGYSRSYRIFPDEPTFAQWYSVSKWDLLTLATCTILALVIYNYVPPIAPRMFPVFYPGGSTVVWPSLVYPRQHEYISTLWSAVISIAVPVIFIVVTSYFFIGSFWDMDNAIMGLSYALATTTLFQILIKIFIGGFRPHFLAACRPNTALGSVPNAYSIPLFTRSACTGTRREINDALMSFPSGHASAAFAGFLFLALYINAKFKVFADYHARHWKLLLFATPLEIALLMTLSKVIDYWHHWYDVFVGAVIGSAFAILGYRMVYMSVWDWRTNHIGTRNRLHTPPDPTVPPTRYYTAINSNGWHNNWSYFLPPKGKPEDAEARAAEVREKEASVFGRPHTDGAMDRPQDPRSRMLDLSLESMGGSLNIDAVPGSGRSRVAWRVNDRRLPASAVGRVGSEPWFNGRFVSGRDGGGGVGGQRIVSNPYSSTGSGSGIAPMVNFSHPRSSGLRDVSLG